MSAEIVLCSTCLPEGALAPLERTLEGLGPRVVRQPCLNACGAPLAMALQGEGRATYLFGGVDPGTDAADAAATVRCWLEAPGGWIEDARACGRLRHCLKGRIGAARGPDA